MPRTARASAGGDHFPPVHRGRTHGTPPRHHWATRAGLVRACAVAVLVVLGAAEAPAQSSSKASPADRHYEDQVRPFFVRHCFECHGGEKPKGDFRIDQLAPDFASDEGRERWQTVRERVEAGKMPPKSKPRPNHDEVLALTAWIGGMVEAAEAAERTTQGRVVLRRLNRLEYENSVRDLLGVNSKLKDLLPLDSSAGGFDNVGDALHTSSFLMERYLEAADTALNQAIANRPKPPAIRKRYRLTETHSVKSAQEHVFRKLDDDRVALFCSSPWQAVGLSTFYPNERGRYRFRISASSIQSSGEPVVYRVLSGGGGMGGAKAHLIGYFDAPVDEPAVVEFVDDMEPRTSISILPYGLPSSQTVHKIGADTYDGPGLAVDWIEVEGPLNDTWPPESHRRIFGDLAQGPAPSYQFRDRVEVVSDDPPRDADRVLRPFIRRAFRRSVTDGDVQPFTTLVAAMLAEKQSFEQAARVGLAAVMSTPEFLFLREAPGKLDDFAIASRLSYFLWSTMPDEELLALAEHGKLNDPATLRSQVERMLDHPKAAAFTENFVGQWLGLRDIDFTEPSRILYPEFDEMLKASMVRETELFFAEVLKQNLSLTHFVASNFSMLNGRLARHYGIPDVEGWEFRKVPLPADSHRGGVLTMASVLKVTANGTNTSPVLRGAWVLERILGTPPPRPPENVPALEPDTRGATTIREQLAKHRQISACASCHVSIDPPGFALESFDVIGGWRDNYRTTGRGKQVMIDGRRMSYLQGPKVDPADVLSDGRSFRNIDEFKERLLEDKDQLARALTTKLLTYATGGPAASADRSRIEAIVASVRDHDYGFRSLIHKIVQSELFQTK
jgi:mono/diheme cytochrome c family protein